MDRLILSDRIRSEDRTLAEITAAQVCQELGMRQIPEIKLFHPSSADEAQRLLGYYRLGVVYLNCRLSQKELLSTVRHECRHAFQDTRPELRRLSHNSLERDARIYEMSEF